MTHNVYVEVFINGKPALDNNAVTRCLRFENRADQARDQFTARSYQISFDKEIDSITILLRQAQLSRTRVDAIFKLYAVGEGGVERFIYQIGIENAVITEISEQLPARYDLHAGKYPAMESIAVQCEYIQWSDGKSNTASVGKEPSDRYIQSTRPHLTETPDRRRRY